MVQRSLPTWLTILHLMWTSRPQSLEDKWKCTGAWAAAWGPVQSDDSWNSWFHFPAALGNCPHCSKYPVPDVRIVVSHCFTDQQTPGAPQRIFGLLWRGRCKTPDPTMQKSWRSLSEQPGPPAADWPPPGQAVRRAKMSPDLVVRAVHVLTLSLNKNHIFCFLSNVGIFWDNEFAVFVSWL